MAKDSREYGYEGEMVMSQLKGIMNHAEQLHDMLEPNTDLPEWVQSKITLAYDYMQTAADYMATEMSEDVVRTGTLAQRTQAYRADKARKAGTNLKTDPDTGTPDHFTAAMRRKKGLPEEVQITELSKPTMKSYMNKADARIMGRTIDDPKAYKKSQNRTMGIEKAGKKVTEEVAVNSAGAGNIAGIGVGPQGEPGVKKKKKIVMSFNRFMKK